MTDQLPLDLPAPEHTFTVRELTSRIHAVVRRAFTDEVWVQGELRNLRANERDGKRNLFFDLVEPGAGLHGRADACVHVVLWDDERRSVNATLRADGPTMKMDEGVQVRVRGRIDWWRRSGDLRLVMQAIDPVFTLGKLAEDRDRLLRELAASGELRANAAHVLGTLPLRVGLVTAASSAAEHDVLHELGASGYAFRVVAVDSPVQGPLAPAGIARALTVLRGRTVPALDAIVVARGGGARTDLACFDHPLVAHAIAACSVPVLTGIGHEIDRSVADEVAHTACKTPTAAAACLVGLVRDACEQLDTSWRAASAGALQALDAHRNRLDQAASQAAGRATACLSRATDRRRGHETRIAASARRALTHETTRLDHATARVPRRALARLQRATTELDHLERSIRALDPERLLERGWSITRHADGRVLRRPGDATAGDQLHIHVAGGRVTSRVESVEETNDG